MKSNEEQIVTYGHIDRDNWSFYLATTNKGLCFVGSPNATIGEMKMWFGKNRPNAKLVKDPGSVSEYADQLIAFLNGERKVFDLPIDIVGTAFQEAVWTILQKIPYGEKQTYTEIAEKVGRPNATRAVGTAIGSNPILIVVPCHRVVSKNGKMAGYRGGVRMKERLLALEHHTCTNV